MRKREIIYLLIFFVLTTVACTKSIVPPSRATLKKSETNTRYDYYYVEGLRNKLIGSPAEAVALFEECIKIDPSRDGAWFQIAQIAYVTGNMPGALSYGRKAVERSANVWYYMLLANAYYQSGKIDSAIVVYQNAEKLFPSHEELKFTLGNLYFQTRQFDKAIEIFNYFDEKYGMAGNSAVPLIRSLIGLGKYDEAEEKLLIMTELYPDENTYRGLLAEMYRDKGDFEKAALIYGELIEENPNDSRVLYSLVDFFRKDNNYRDLFGLMNAIALNEIIPVEEKVNIYAGLLEDEEIIKNFSNEYEMSLLILEAAHSDVAVVHLLRSEIYQLTGRKKEAVENLELYILKWPENYYAWEKLLLLHIGASEYEKLYASSSAAVRRFNTAVLPRLLNAAAAVEVGFYDEALTQLKNVRKLSNENQELIIQILTIEADALYRKGLTEEAFTKFSEILKLAPEDLTALNNYAYFLAEKETRLKDAKEMIEKVIEAEPANITFLDTQAWVYYKQKKYRKAEMIMRTILDSDEKENAEYYDHYGFILKALRRCEEAVMAWNKALELDDSKEKLKEEIEKCLRDR
jgi:tetratricopeptide (TPR) repeat protein